MLVLQFKKGTLNVNLEHTFTSSTSEVINHNLGYYPIVRVFTNTNEEIQPLSVVHNSVNQITITFSTATTGTAVML